MRKAEWVSQLERHQATRATRAAELQAIEDRLTALQDEWNELVQPLGVSVRTPPELRAWLRRRAEVVQIMEKFREACRSLEQIERSRTENLKALNRALGELGEPTLPSGSSLGHGLERAESVVTRFDEVLQRRRLLEGKRADARSQLGRYRQDLQAAEAERTAWRSDWAPKMARIGLEPDALPEQAEVFLNGIQDLRETMDKHREFQSRVRGIDRDAEEFGKIVADLCRRVAPDLLDPNLPDQAPEHRARILSRRLQDARSIEDRRATLIQQREHERERLQTAESHRDDANTCLDRLCQEAGCATTEEVPEVERRSIERARVEDALRQCDDQLLAAGAGATAEDFAAAVQRENADSLGLAIDQLECALTNLQTELEATNQTIGLERGELERMNGSDRAAEASEKAQTVLARLQTDVARFATLKMASSVLRQAIESYREKQQGPVLERASRLFADLTAGSFARLQIDDDGEGHAVLKGVRPDGRLVGVEGMSDGSHDQLYLALRLASLESWLAIHEPIPFIVDDILLNFDDRCALAALQSLAEFSSKTQVLLFTHHRHLVELARANLPGDVVFLHELSALHDTARR